MYAEVRAAGKLDELIDLAMSSSDTRHGDESNAALRADRADDESLFGGGTAKPSEPRRPINRSDRSDGFTGKRTPRVGKTGAKTEDVGMAVFRRKAAIEQRERRAGRPRGSTRRAKGRATRNPNSPNSANSATNRPNRPRPSGPRSRGRWTTSRKRARYR